ncbi:MAG: site-2 protease family protein, partial [bacterium]
VMLIIELAMLFVGIMIHLIVHEAGHMVFGLLTHYRFSSFRIGSWMLQKNASGFHLKRFSIPGTAGQCLMVPPQDQKNFPYVLSNLGGGLANLIVSGLSLVAYFYT